MSLELLLQTQDKLQFWYRICSAFVILIWATEVLYGLDVYYMQDASSYYIHQCSAARPPIDWFWFLLNKICYYAVAARVSDSHSKGTRFET